MFQLGEQATMVTNEIRNWGAKYIQEKDIVGIAPGAIEELVALTRESSVRLIKRILGDNDVSGNKLPMQLAASTSHAVDRSFSFTCLVFHNVCAPISWCIPSVFSVCTRRFMRARIVRPGAPLTGNRRFFCVRCLVIACTSDAPPKLVGARLLPGSWPEPWQAREEAESRGRA